MKKLIFLVVAMALALSALAACGGDSDDKQEPAAVTEPAPGFRFIIRFDRCAV